MAACVKDMSEQLNIWRQALRGMAGHDVPARLAQPELPGSPELPGLPELPELRELPDSGGNDHEPASQTPGVPGVARDDLSRTWDEDGSITARIHLSRTARQRLVRAWRQAHPRETRADEGDESDRLIA
jgi:hypothetical protein